MWRPTQGANRTTISPSRKRLLSDPKPKQGSTASSSDSALPSEPSSDRILRMKTRDQPNLSHCHSCGLRVNATDPKDRLQTLDSVWRIVLLCRRCTKRVESAELCSYCFSEIEADCFRCRDCERRVHGDCVAKYRRFAPWSYCCPELGFSVCIDCWVPKVLANSNRVYKKRRRKNKNNVLKPYNLGASRVSDDSGRPRSVEDVAAVKAKESEFRKADIASRASESVGAEVELLAKKYENGAKNECLNSSDSDTTTMVVDDAEQASQMHLAVNRSPANSKNPCLIELSCLTFSRRRDANGNLLVGSLGSRRSNNGVCGKIESCANNKLIKNTNGNSVCLRSSANVSPISLSMPKWKGIVYTRRCKRDNESRKNIDVIVGNCNPSNGNSQISEVQSCKRHVELEYELHPDDIRNQIQLGCDGNAAILDDGRCSGKLDRYKLKYRKRPVGLKMISRCNWKHDRYMLKYSRRHVGLKVSSRCNGKVDRCMLKYSKRYVG